jgi:NAD(P)H dehydrogenase (quinone)
MNFERGGSATTPHHVVVLGHPAPGSFNHAIAERYCETVRACDQYANLRDLYELGFDPRLYADHRPGRDTNTTSGDVAGEMGSLRNADAIVFVYPIWFGMPPAMIKGYVDRVLGHALTPKDITKHLPDCFLEGRHFATISTSATTLPWLDQQGQLESLKTTFDHYLLQVFGMIDAGHTHFAGIVEGLAKAEGEEILAAVEAKAREICAAIEARRTAIRSRPLMGADLE